MVMDWGGKNRRVYKRNFNPPPNFGGLIPFLFHILRFQVSRVRNDEQRRWYLTPETRHTGRNKYGIYFKAILWAILIILVLVVVRIIKLLLDNLKT
jgi:hypothetical protein